MIVAFDVHYTADGCAFAAAVLFCDYRDPAPVKIVTQFFPEAADYIPGEFYRRELPCILRLLAQIKENPDEIVVDGYVKIGERPGLGQHLFKSLGGRIPVIGVAKSKFKGSCGAEVLRGKSKRPLYVTSAGMDLQKASERIRTMHGTHRIPTLLKRVDLAAKGKAARE